MSELEELLGKCERATGSDRAIDGLLYQLSDDITKRCWPYWDSFQREELTPRYTASVDAALALVERMVPDTPIFLADDKSEDDLPCSCDLSNGTVEPWKASAKTLPLAILAALLRALIVKG